MKIKIAVAVILAVLAGVVCKSQQKAEGGVAGLTYQGKPVTKISCTWNKRPNPCILLQGGELVFNFE